MNWAKGRATRGRGTSFKGALKYVLHDQGASTSDRVGLIALRNLATAHADDAWREMMVLCEAADGLKRRAGVKATGRKLAKPVYAFTLNWHEDDQPDPDHMLETALAALEALGMADLQAVIVEHTDRPHRHVHIIVNLVDPQTGKSAFLSNDDHKLDRWADSYEVRHGTIRSPDRRAKFAALDKDQTPPDRPPQPTSREEWEARKLKGAAFKKQAAALSAAFAARTGQLKARQAERDKARRAAQERLWEAHQAECKADRARYQPFIDAAYGKRSPSPAPAAAQAALHDLENMAEWKAFGQRQSRRRRTFSARERSSLGVIINIVSLYGRLDRGGLTRLFLLSVSRKYRANRFADTVEHDKLALRAAQSGRRKAHVNALRAACRHELAERAAAFRTSAAALRQAHQSEFADQRAAWRLLATERDQAWADLRAEFGFPARPTSQPPASFLRGQFAAATAQGGQTATEDAKGKGDGKGAGRQGGGTGGTGAGGGKSPPRNREWRAHRSATERKADGSYKPRNRPKAPDR